VVEKSLALQTGIASVAMLEPVEARLRVGGARCVQETGSAIGIVLVVGGGRFRRRKKALPPVSPLLSSTMSPLLWSSALLRVL